MSDDTPIAEMADASVPEPIYFKTESSFGSASSEEVVPLGATIITKEEYDALLLAREQELADQAELEMQEAYARFVVAYRSYRQLGLPELNAKLLAAQSGIEPPDFDPTWPLP